MNGSFGWKRKRCSASRFSVDSFPNAVLSHLQRVLDAPDLSGTKYEMIEEIGRGGMGTVYRVRDRELDRDVALKVLDSMVTEARILAYLEHPGIVPVHDAGNLPDGRFYYAMKLVKGERLDRYALKKPPLMEVLRVFVRVCEPVAFAHAQGVVHRDLKPENIMTGMFGEVLVLDWGVANVAGSDPSDDRGAVIGTPGYMAPEQAAAAVDEIDSRSDIYALGKILSFLLASQVDRIPRSLQAITAKAAAPERAKRYGSALDLAADIERFLDGQAVLAYRENLIERGVRLLSRNKALVSLLAAYLLMRIVILLIFRR